MLYPIIKRKRVVRGAERLRGRVRVPQPLVTEVIHSAVLAARATEGKSPDELQSEVNRAKALKARGKPFGPKPGK